VRAGEVRLEVRADGHATRWVPSGDVESDGPPLALDGERIDVGDVALEPGAVLDVSLIEEADGARVRVRRSPDGAVLGQGLAEGGRAGFSGLPGTDVFVEVLPVAQSGLVGARGAEVALSPDVAVQMDLEVPAGGIFEGTVRRREGPALRGARVELVGHQTEIGLLAPAAATTDGDGVFRIGPVGAGVARVRVSWSPFCSEDPGRVDVFAPSARTEAAGTLFEIVPGEVVDLGEIALPYDGDRDGMDDAWELLWGLDPTRGDGSGDRDGDGVSNLDEYLGGTDPLGAIRVADGEGCASISMGRPPSSLGPIVLAVIAAARRRRARSAVC
jgi:hypothetical protein